VGLPSDPSAVDEAVGLARSICSATSDAICFCLLPVVHASTRQEIVVKHRRHMEDLMMAILGFWLNLDSCRVPEFIG